MDEQKTVAVNKVTNAVIVAATIVYAVFPLDLVPDFIPVLGWADDLVALGYGLKKAYELYQAAKAEG